MQKKYGSLDNISAFKFENHMFKLKQKIKTSAKPLQQVSNRINENSKITAVKINPSYPFLEHMLLKNEAFEYFKILKFRTFTLSTKRPENFCLLKNNNILEISCIKFDMNAKKTFLGGKLYSNRQNVFDSPCESILLNMFSINLDDFIECENIEVSTVAKKCLRLEIGNNDYAVIPLSHSSY